MPQPVTADPDGHLHTLRRLYHHVLHGGQTTEGDAERLGAEPTLANIAAAIIRLEAQQRRRHLKEGSP